MEKYKTRNEVPEEYKWDLSKIYDSLSSFEEDYKLVSKMIDELSDYEASFLDSGETIYNTFVFDDKIGVILDKMDVYTSHAHDTDLSDNKLQELKERVSNLYDKFANVISFIKPKLLSLSLDDLDNMCDSFPKLRDEYGFVLELFFRYKNYTLSEAEEKLMTKLNKAYSNTYDISEMLTASEIDFGSVTDENGEEVKLTGTNFVSLLHSQNRDFRKDVFDTFYKSYGQFNNTLALSLAAEINSRVTFAKVKGYNSAREASLYSDNVTTKVYDNLVDSVSNNLKPLYEYYDIKRKLLELDSIHMYDVYTPVVSSLNKYYSFEDSKKLVIDALSILGEDYVSNLKKAFDERWVDVYPTPNKRGGAYSGGSYLTNPYVLLNHTGTYHDVSTIAHELGHSMHSYYSHMNNPYQYADYQIFVAEVASQVNEMLFNDYMLKHASSNEEKLDILNNILELFKASIYRQTMFAEFEYDITDVVENDGVLTADRMNSIYYELVKKYFGPDVVVDDAIKYEWSRIPHFYYNFYVYKYSTGLAAASYIASRIINGEEGALEEYLAFLKTGGSMYPLDELKIAGVDLENPEVIDGALDMFAGYVDDFKKLVR